jgi:hypothetical protein
MVRKGLADYPHNQRLTLVIGFGHRVDDAFHGDLVGFLVVEAHDRAGGQGGLPPDLGYFVRHVSLPRLLGLVGYLASERIIYLTGSGETPVPAMERRWAVPTLHFSGC